MLRVHLGFQILVPYIFKIWSFQFVCHIVWNFVPKFHFWWSFHETLGICIYILYLYITYIYIQIIHSYFVDSFDLSQLVELDFRCPWIWSNQPTIFVSFASGSQATSRQPTMHRRDVVRHQWWRLPWWFDVSEDLFFHSIMGGWRGTIYGNCWFQLS